MIDKPRIGEDIRSWCSRLVDELRPLFNLTTIGAAALRKDPGGWSLSLLNGGAFLHPFKVTTYIDPPDTPAESARTHHVKVRGGWCMVDGFGAAFFESTDPLAIRRAISTSSCPSPRPCRAR